MDDVFVTIMTSLRD